MTTVKGDMITALDLSKVVMTSSDKQSKTSNLLTKEDLAFQEARRNRTVRKLDFEIR
jgi:hypothetical protein